MKLHLTLLLLICFFLNYAQNSTATFKSIDTSKNGVFAINESNGSATWQYFKRGIVLYKNLVKLPSGFCIDGNCNTGKGKILNDNGSVYEGDVLDGKMHGKGKMLYTSGAIFTGSFSNGRISGNGKMIWTDGSFYDGSWVDDAREGFGYYKWTENTTYKGYWHNSKKNGKGILTYEDGNIYDGNFLNDQCDGIGTYTWNSGDLKGNKYRGNWSNALRSGKGIYTTIKGEKYEGNFNNGSFFGEGVYTLLNGDVYKSNVWNGYGFTEGVMIRKANPIPVKGVLKDNKFDTISVKVSTENISITQNSPKNYSMLIKHIIESSARNFKDSIGEKFTNERGEAFKASNYIDADETYYNKPVDNVGTTFFAVYKYENKNKDAVQKQMTDFINNYKTQGLADVEPSTKNGVNFLLMKAKDNGKFIAALSDDPATKQFQVWVFSGWNDVKPPNEFCTALQKAITVAQAGAFSLNELMAEPNRTGPIFKNTDSDNYWYDSKLQMPNVEQTVLAKNTDKITFKAVMSVYKFEYMVRPKYDEVVKKIESCINDLKLHVTKEKNGPQNTFYSGDRFTIGVRWFTRNDEFIIYVEVYHS